MINRKKVGVALGSGSARGWSHIGVLKELREMGIEPDVYAGCSVGSLVGAVSAMDYLDEFEKWVRSLNWRDVWGLVDVSLAGGLVRGDKLLSFFKEAGIDINIEDMGCVYGAVATDLETGQEQWLKQGAVLEAVRASCTFPGLFQPVCRDGSWLLDGGLVNPVPVSLCRALGADIVIAVDLNTQLVGRHGVMPQNGHNKVEEDLHPDDSGTLKRMKSWLSSATSKNESREENPGIMEVMAASINIMQDRITRSRMAGDPPDVLLSPRVSDIGMTDFERAPDAIREGVAVVKSARHRILDICRLPVELPELEHH
ncbi:patatin-like phospholipase RssA [Parendozoicomonas sp. Alg238-R29]|uniref:patatin-like phospholipase RssA n=1 Tax=Parendozoicomonas sp. Alg238-R29 TaxID=2993446 RepID=UPI00248E352E|nr:patatin-like phospholipase RssA [Parendozoicomonas sp. Alg238-R29]